MLFYPDFYFHRVWEIPPEWPGSQGIKALLLDVDNTLTMHNAPEVPAEVRDWIARMGQTDVRLLLLSNNNSRRVASFAADLGLDYIANAAKPLGGGVRRAMKRLGISGREMAVVGDQIFTDVLCANLAGVRSVFVELIEPESSGFFKMKRRLEQRVLKGYDKRRKRQ